jgi:cobaltochelatase CobS
MQEKEIIRSISQMKAEAEKLTFLGNVFPLLPGFDAKLILDTVGNQGIKDEDKIQIIREILQKKVSVKVKSLFDMELDPKVTDPARIAAFEEATVDVGVTSHRIKKNYIFDHVKLKKALLWLSGRHSYKNLGAIGDAGAGKTSFFKELAARLGIPFDSMSCSGDTRFEAFFGRRELRDGNTIYVEQGLAKRWREGGIFCANELFRMDSGESMRLVDALDEDGHLTNPETGEVIPKHPEFRFCFTANSGGFGDETGVYVGEKPASLALRDRFVILMFKSMSEEQELKMLLNAVPELEQTRDLAERMVKVARAVRENFVGNGGGLPIDISPRGLERWGHAMAAYSSMSGIESAFTESLEDTILNGTPKTVFDTVMDLVQQWV